MILTFFSAQSRGFWVRITVLTLLVALVGCGDKSKSGSRGRGAGGAAPVYVGKVQRKVVPLTVDAIGAVEPIRTASIRSQVTGTLQKIMFQEGQEVKAGDLLMEIDPRPSQNALRSAEADLQKNRVQFENAQSQVERYRALNANAMISQEEFRTILDNERTLRAALAASEAAMEIAKLQLEYCVIRAPISGRTGNLGAHEGDLVRASDANVVLVVINQLTPIYATFSVPQQFLGDFSRYRAAGKIFVAGRPSGSTEFTEKGELTFLDNNVDATTGTLKLKATFTNEAHRLWPGQFVSVRITLSSPEVLVVPASAIQNDQKGQHVFVVKADKTAEFRSITVERTVGEDAVVTQGLAEGETIVIDGQLRVLSGKPVDIKQPSSETSPAPAKGKGKGKAK